MSKDKYDVAVDILVALAPTQHANERLGSTRDGQWSVNFAPPYLVCQAIDAAEQILAGVEAQRLEDERGLRMLERSPLPSGS